MGKLVFGRYDYAACLTFAAYAICSMVIPMTLVAMAADLGFPLDEGGMGRGGALQLALSTTMVISMVFCGFASGLWGKRRTLGAAVLLMAIGIVACSIAPVYSIVLAALIFAGLGEGVIEGLATPFVQDLHQDQPGRYLNFSHGFWSIGVVSFTLVAGALLLYGVSWRYLVFGVGLIAFIPAMLFLLPGKANPYPDHADKLHWREVCRNAATILRQRRFWLFFASMFFAGGAEFCLTFWCASFIQIEYGGTAWAAGAGTAFFAGGMIVGRLGSSYLVHQNNLKALLVCFAFIAGVVSVFFPFLSSLWLLFVLLFVSGIATGPFWPSIQSVGAMRVGGDNTMMMILYSCAGVPGCGIFTILMGILGDMVGLRASFFIVPFCFLILFILIAYDWLTERRERTAPSANAPA